MTLNQAIAKAAKLSKQYDRCYFVVREAGEIDVCSEFDLDTFYCGISDQNILYCTDQY